MKNEKHSDRRFYDDEGQVKNSNIAFEIAKIEDKGHSQLPESVAEKASSHLL